MEYSYLFDHEKINRNENKIREIASAIQAGAKAYLNRQYRTITIIAVVLFIVLWIFLG